MPGALARTLEPQAGRPYRILAAFAQAYGDFARAPHVWQELRPEADAERTLEGVAPHSATPPTPPHVRDD